MKFPSSVGRVLLAFVANQDSYVAKVVPVPFLKAEGVAVSSFYPLCGYCSTKTLERRTKSLNGIFY